MVRALQATGIVAVVLSGLVLFLCVEGWSANRPVDKLPSALEQSRQTDGKHITVGYSQTSPLVRQAEAFAMYLNPPASVTPSDARRADPAIQQATKLQERQVPVATAVQPAVSSAKFELHGISYYRANPDLSMALICEQGGARRWVRQGDQLGHLSVERIDRDGLVYREGSETHVLALASGEAVAQFAKAIEDALPRKPSVAPSTSIPAPPAVRGLRQIPLSRVAAKLGRPSLEAGSSSDRQMETE